MWEDLRSKHPATSAMFSSSAGTSQKHVWAIQLDQGHTFQILCSLHPAQELLPITRPQTPGIPIWVLNGPSIRPPTNCARDQRGLVLKASEERVPPPTGSWACTRSGCGRGVSRQARDTWVGGPWRTGGPTEGGCPQEPGDGRRPPSGEPAEPSESSTEGAPRAARQDPRPVLLAARGTRRTEVSQAHPPASPWGPSPK